jgi:hypothetical protein
LKPHISHQFQTKDLGKVHYLLGIEVAHSKDDAVISERKYAMNILEESRLVNVKPVKNPMDSNVKLLPSRGEDVVNIREI